MSPGSVFLHFHRVGGQPLLSDQDSCLQPCFATLWVKALSERGSEVEGSLQPRELRSHGLVDCGSRQRCPGWPEVCLKLELRCVCPQHENKQGLGFGAADALGGRVLRTLAQSRRVLGAHLQQQEEEGSREGKVWQQEGGRDSSSPRLG